VALAVASLFSAGALLADSEKEIGQKGERTETAPQIHEQQAEDGSLRDVREWAKDPQTACDKLFVLGTAVDGMWEVRLSQQAEQKTQNPKIKELAQKMIQDHQQLNQKLEQVAQGLGVRVPQALPRLKQEELQIFAALPEQDYDKAYIAQLHIGHAKAIAAFHAASELAKNEQVKQFAAANLPTLKEHLRMVKEEAVVLGIARDTDEAQPAGAHIPANTGARDASTPAPAR